jgi:predicted nucleic acid-binding protein
VTPTYLIDTNIVSELARRAPNENVVAFVAAQRKLLVSSILFHELAYGLEIAALEERVRLTAFLSAMRERFGTTAVPVDVPVAETAGRLRAFARGRGRTMSVADSLIAASAMGRGATLVTRNTRDFETSGVALHNPFR